MLKKFTLSFLFFLPVFFLHAQSQEYVQNLVDTHFQSDEKVPVVFSKVEATLRDGCESSPDSIISRVWENEAWKIDTRRIYEYDDEGRVVSEFFERIDFSTGMLIFDFMIETVYSENQSVATTRDFNVDTGVFELQTRAINTIENDLVTVSISDNYLNGEWEPNRRYTYEYNEIGSRTGSFTEIWNPVSEEYVLIRRSLNFYTIIDEIAYADSLISQEYNSSTEEWEYYGIRVDIVRDAQNRTFSAKLGDYFSIPGELYIFLRDDFFYDDEGDSYDVLNHHDLMNEQPEELPLRRKIRNYFENGLNVVDSIYNYDAEAMAFNLDKVTTLDYDIAERLYLRTGQDITEDTDELTNSFQVENYYQLCISDTEEEFVSSADCKFANPIHNGQRGICDLETSENARLNLYDILGRKVLEQPIINGQSFSFGQLPANGTYFMTIENEKGLMLQRKLIVAN